MLPEKVITPIMFDPAFYPAWPAMSVMELCLDGLSAGKDMHVPVSVKKSIASVWEAFQMVFPGYRACKVTELFMEKCKGLQQVSCPVAEKTVLGRICKRAHGSPQSFIRIEACCC